MRGEKQKERIERSKGKAAKNVVIGNPPYNVGQVNENDNNKNRKSSMNWTCEIRNYSKDSTATLQDEALTMLM